MRLVTLLDFNAVDSHLCFLPGLGRVCPSRAYKSTGLLVARGA